MTSPRPKAVVVGSLALFAVLFVLLTFQLSAKATSGGSGHGKATAKSQPAAVEAKPEPEEAPAEYAEPEYAEPEPEYEYVEPESEEVPPVVTSSS